MPKQAAKLQMVWLTLRTMVKSGSAHVRICRCRS